VETSVDPVRFLHEQLAQASPDPLRQMLTTFINTLMSAEADVVCGAQNRTVRDRSRLRAVSSSTPSCR
jgi:transposase-like protein